jgi:hypothetical protein
MLLGERWSRFKSFASSPRDQGFESYRGHDHFFCMTLFIEGKGLEIGANKLHTFMDMFDLNV